MGFLYIHFYRNILGYDFWENTLRWYRKLDDMDSHTFVFDMLCRTGTPRWLHILAYN